jgi:hypothetical protein
MIFSNYKFDKNSHVILNPRNFAGAMVKVPLVFCIFLSLIFFTPEAPGKPGPFSTSSLKTAEFNPFLLNGKVGLKNQKGEILIPAQYEALGWSDGSFSVVENVTGYRDKGKWGLINLTNHKITKADFEDVSPGHGTMIVARKKLPHSVAILTGCINPSGKTIIPFQYDGLRISNLRAIVYKKEGFKFRHGLIDFSNHVIIPLQYETIYPLGSLRYSVVDSQNKMAIFTEEGIRLTEFVIDSISSFVNNKAVFYQDRMQGLISRDGKTLLQPEFNQIKINDDGAVLVTKGNTWSFLNGENKLVRQFHADSIQAIDERLYKLKFSGNSVLADQNLNLLTKTHFGHIGSFRNQFALVSFGDRNGIIRKNGSFLLEPRYKEIFIEGKFVRARIAGDRNQWVLFDTLAKTITPKTYQYIGPYNGLFFPVLSKGFWGALDERGKEFVACVHDSLIHTAAELVIVKFKGQYGIINRNEEWVVTPQRNRLQLIDGERYLELTTNKFLKSIKGGVIYFTENRIEIKKDHFLEYVSSGEIWKVNFNGVIIDRFTEQEGVESISVESEGYRAIRKDGRYGFIDNRSRLRIANRYEDVKNFNEGLAGAKILGKWGFISKEDKIAIQPVYDDVSSFHDGYAVVRQKKSFGLIDKSGKVIIPVRYDAIESLDGTRFRIIQNGLIGICDKNGNIILNPKYNSVQVVDQNYLIVERDGKFGVMTTSGLSTIPMIYDGLMYDHFHNQYLALTRAVWESVQL